MSVPSNIAEGYGRKTTADDIRWLYVAYGSNCELETQVLLAGDLGDIEAGKLEKRIDTIAEVERMLRALIKSLENKHLNPRILAYFRKTCLPCRQDFLQLIWRRTFFDNQQIQSARIKPLRLFFLASAVHHNLADFFG